MLLFTRPPDAAVAVARRAREQLPPALTDQRDALLALELYAVAFGATDDVVARPRERAASVGGCSPPCALGTARSPAAPRPCVEEARYALGDGVLVRHDRRS
jgi:hypothetical protein